MTGDDGGPPSKRRKGKEVVFPAKTIRFKVTPAGSLRESLLPLCHPEFNPCRIAMVEVTPKGFRITVRNEETNVRATLFFRSSMLLDFRCTRPLSPHFIFLDHILQFLTDIPDDQTVTVLHVDGTDEPQLVFKCKIEYAPTNKVTVDLMNILGKPQRFPVSAIPVCQAQITSIILNQVIKQLKKKPQLVSMKVKRKRATITLRDELSDEWEEWQTDGGTSMRPGEKHYAVFNLPYLESMRLASSFDPDPCIYFLCDPRDHIVIRFGLGKLGELMFLLKVETLLFVTDDKDSSGSDSFGMSGDDTHS